MGPLIPLALTAYNAVQSGRQQGKADKLQQQSLDMAKQQYAERSPFRQMALNGINAANAPVNSGGIFNNTANPFSKSYNFNQDLGANRTPNIDVAGSQSAATGQQNARDLESAKNALRQSGVPVGVQQRIMQGWDKAGTAGAPMAQPAMPNQQPQPNPQAMMQAQFLSRYQGGGR